VARRATTQVRACPSLDSSRRLPRQNTSVRSRVRVPVDAKKKRFHTFCQDDRWGAAARVGKTTIIIASFKVSPDQVILATQNLARLAPPRTGRQLSPPLPSTTEGAARAGGWVPRKRVFCLTVRGA
jgi:hypothetical protein